MLPKTSPISSQSDDPTVQELVDLFNSMLNKAQAALEDYTGATSWPASRAS